MDSASPDPEVLGQQGAGEPDDAFLVRAAHHEGAVRAQHFLERDQVAGPLVAEARHHQQRLVEQHFLADRELVHVDQRADPHPHLAPGVEDVHGFLGGRLAAVAGRRQPPRVQLQHGAEAVRRLALLVQGVLEPEDLGLGRLQHRHQLGVVLRRGGKLAVDVPEFVPEDIDLPFRNGQLVRGIAVALGTLCR